MPQLSTFREQPDAFPALSTGRVPARVPDTNARGVLAESRRQRAAIAELTRSQRKLQRQVMAAERRAKARSLRLTRRVARARRDARRVVEQNRLLAVRAREARAESARQRERIVALETSNQVQQWTAIVNVMQATAFGDTGSLLSTSNLLLAGNQFAWSAMEPLMRSLDVISGPSPSFLTWLTPVGSLITGHLLLADRQHVRFISGVATVVPGATVVEPLRNRIAGRLWPSFQRRTDVPVTIVPLDPNTPRLLGVVRDGVLEIRPDPPAGGRPPRRGGGGGVGIVAPPGAPAVPRRVAWMIDTGAGRG